MVAVQQPPNPRVQRTRSSPSARHSPLTRHPLGGPGTRWAWVPSRGRASSVAVFNPAARPR